MKRPSLNHTYRLVWNEILNAFVAVAENVRAKGKSSGRAACLLATGLLLAGAAGSSGASGGGLPSGGLVVAGSGAIKQSGSTMTVKQNSGRMAIDWQSFSIGKGNTVNFVQPSASAVVLNRVLGSDVSVIQGALNANGQVFLINPNGVLFSPSAQVNVGSLVASTLGISNADFMAGNYRFEGSSSNAIINQGNVTAHAGGTLALIAAEISNDGNLNAPGGNVLLGAGSKVTLDMGGPVKLQIERGALDALIESGGAIRAEGGSVFLQAKAAGDLAASVINHSGLIEANRLEKKGGEIRITADLVVHNGQTKASGGDVEVNAAWLTDGGVTDVSATGDAGTITQKALRLQQSAAAELKADSLKGKGGQIALLGDVRDADAGAYLSGTASAKGVAGGTIDVTAREIVLANASLDTSGSTTAGRIRVGGGWQGKDAGLANAQRTIVDRQSQLTNRGAGGTVVAWSDRETIFDATLSAPGSKVEVSSKDTLVFGSSRRTQAKTLLLDPKNIEIKDAASLLSYISIFNPPNNAGATFGTAITELSNGDLIITAPNTTVAGQAAAGAVYHYAPDGTLRATLTGSAANDKVGLGGVTPLTGNANYVVRSQEWNTKAGAVTWASGTSGVNDVVSSANSLVGTISGATVNDSVGSDGVVALTNGHYVVASALWDNGGTANVGAVTWGNGTTGISGTISDSNSLIGSTSGDTVGRVSSSLGVTALSNGNYVVRSSYWDNGAVQNAGAVTWGNGTAGTVGVVSSSNSLVGSTMSDQVGWVTGAKGLTVLSNGNYILSSPFWNNGAVAEAGAVTWVNGANGKLTDGNMGGTISASNSLVGSYANDKVGNVDITPLTNGNFVVVTPIWWGNGSSGRGAVTWMNGATGQLSGGANGGAISAANSLVGSQDTNSVGGTGVVALTNGNYVVTSASWDISSPTQLNNVGAVTWGNGSTGTVGQVSASNSLVGTTAGEQIGTINGSANGVVALTNGNYVVASNLWNTQRGAVTWADGTTGITGNISASNSLVGSTPWVSGGTDGDKLGLAVSTLGVHALNNGNYVVRSTQWDDGAVTNVGAVTWGNGATGTFGAVSSANSLVGSTSGDAVGNTRLTTLSNGNFVVTSTGWKNGTAASAGAVTWFNGSNGRLADGTLGGPVSASNSLVGSTGNDQVGSTSVTALTNGNYVVASQTWDNAGLMDAGAVTWGSGTAGVVGTVSATNSLVGGKLADRVGEGGVAALANGNYVVRSQSWDNGTISDAGAVTWGDGSSGVSGTITQNNSLVGSVANDQVGSSGLVTLADGNYVVRSQLWDNGSLTNAGAITWGNGSTGVSGVVSAGNSILGDYANLTLGGNTHTVTGLSSGVVVGVPAYANATSGKTGGAVFITRGQVSGGGSGDAVSSATFGNNPSGNSIITPADIQALLNAGTAVTLQANNDITVTKAITANNPGGNGGALTFEAGRNINLNASINTDNGDFTAIAGAPSANAAYKDAGTPTITVANGVSINAGTGRIKLSGGAFTNQAGATPFTAAATEIYLPSFTNATLGGLTVHNKRYNTTYAGGCLTAGCVFPTSGVSMLYATAPFLDVAPSSGQTAIYGDDYTAAGHGLSGFVNGDSVLTAGISGTATFTVDGALSSAGKWVAGSHDIAYVSGLASALGYQFRDSASSTNELTVAAKDITANYVAASRAYNGTNGASIAASSGGILAGDLVSISAGGLFVDGNAANGKTVNVSGGALSGADAGNYSLQNTTGTTTADISRLTISVTGLSASDKVYDGTTQTSLAGAAALAGVIAADRANVGLSGAAFGQFADANVGNNKAVSVTGLSLTGSAAGNYSLTAPAGFAANITPRPITIAASGGQGKTYGDRDSSLLYTLEASGNGRGLVAGDTFTGTLNRAAGENVGSYSIGQGSLANSNYAIDFVPSGFAIMPRPITIAASSGQGKTYGDRDPSLLYTLEASGNGRGLVAGDTFTGALNRAAGENVGSYLIGQGSLANSNYAIDFVASGFVITPRQIAVEVDSKSKVFGQLDPALTYRISSGSLVGNDTLGSLVRVAGEGVGSYAILGSSLRNDNYQITAGNGSLTITADNTLDAAIASTHAVTQTVFVPAATSGAVQASSQTLGNTPPAVVTTSQGSTLPVVNVSGGLAMVQVGAPAGQGGGTTGVPNVAELPSGVGGRDPFGFMRVFVVNGGLNMSPVALSLLEQTPQDSAGQ